MDLDDIYALERICTNAKMAKMIQNITFTAFDNFIHYQIAQNRVKVATDANIFEDKTFFEVPLKNFLLTS